MSPPEPSPPDDVDLNQVVAYNIREARQLRGWTQEDLAARLEPYLGQRLSQAGISAIERAWDGDRRREFDAHELLVYAVVFNLPIIWFLLPPPDDHRRIDATSLRVDQLYAALLGSPGQLQPVYNRLRQIGIADPTTADAAVEEITGIPSESGQWSYRERRKELLLALLDQHADSFDANIDELGRVIDHLRQVGIRGFIAEHAGDEDFTYRNDQPPTTADADQTTPDETSQDGTDGS